jgi:methionyl-tRNA synthetase
MIAKNFGAIPEQVALTDADHAVLASGRQAFATVGEHLQRQRLRQAITEAMRVAGDANQYLSQQAPWKESDPERKGTILSVAAQLVADSNRLLAPFLPHSAQQVHEALGGTGSFGDRPEIREVADLDGGPGYPVITGDYSLRTTWASQPVVPGTRVPDAAPIFAKLE